MTNKINNPIFRKSDNLFGNNINPTANEITKI